MKRLRKRLWLAGSACAVPARRGGQRLHAGGETGHAQVRRADFLAFYTAGRSSHRAVDRLYDLNAVKRFSRISHSAKAWSSGARTAAHTEPAFFAWVFVPLSALSYSTAWTTWTLINLLCFTGAMAILVAWASRSCHSNWRTWGLIPLLTITSMPFIGALGHGQNTCISLLILSTTVALWRSNRALAAGAVAGLLFYKPQLAAIVATALVLSCGGRALAGLAMTGTALLLTTVITLPGALQHSATPPRKHRRDADHPPYLGPAVTLKAFGGCCSRVMRRRSDAADRALYFLSAVPLPRASSRRF